MLYYRRNDEPAVLPFSSIATPFCNFSPILLLFFNYAKTISDFSADFLTDYLQGDVYFKIARENHNLDRCRTQLKLVEDMEAKWDQMQEIVQNKKIIFLTNAIL